MKQAYKFLVGLGGILLATCSANAGVTSTHYESNSSERYSLDTSFEEFYESYFRMNQGNIELCLNKDNCSKWVGIKTLRQGNKVPSYYTLYQTGGSTYLRVFFVPPIK